MSPRPRRTPPPAGPAPAPEPVERWTADPQGALEPGQQAGEPRGRWLRWAHLGQLEFTAHQVTPNSYRVMVVYRVHGVPHTQNLGLVVRADSLWRPYGEHARIRPDPARTMRGAAEGLARRTTPDHPAPDAAESEGGG